MLPWWILPVAMARIATSCATWFRMSLIVRGGGAVTFGLGGLESRRTSAPRLLRLALLLRYTDIASQRHDHQHHITITYLGSRGSFRVLGICCFYHATDCH